MANFYKVVTQDTVEAWIDNDNNIPRSVLFYENPRDALQEPRDPSLQVPVVAVVRDCHEYFTPNLSAEQPGYTTRQNVPFKGTLRTFLTPNDALRAYDMTQKKEKKATMPLEAHFS